MEFQTLKREKRSLTVLDVQTDSMTCVREIPQ